MFRHIITTAAVALVGLTANTQIAAAASVTGHSALALGAIAGGYSPMLSNSAKTILAKLLDGKAFPGKSTITVTADAVVCHAGNVDIAAFGCELTFGAKKVALTGRKAHELFATIAEAGVPPDGAAGTIYEALHTFSCTIDPAAIAQKNGSGATCNFIPGPP